MKPTSAAMEGLGRQHTCPGALGAADRTQGAAGMARIIGAVLCAFVTACAPIEIVYYRFTPLVVDESTTSPATFEARVRGNPSSVMVELARTGTEIALVDDGSGSDHTAGDGLYTVDIAAAEVLFNFTPQDVYRNFVGYLRAYDGAVVEQQANVFIDIVTSAIPTPTVVKPSPTFQYSQHLVNIVRPAFYSDFDQVSLVHQFYTLVHDDFDFLAIVYEGSHLSNRYSAGVRNDVNGIGLPVFDNSGVWGSAGRLKGRLVFPISTMFDAASPAFNHELGHGWVNHLPVAPLDVGNPHWPLSDLAVGIMGWTSAFNPSNPQGLQFNFDLVPNGPDYDLVPNNAPKEFTDLSLYLMGFVPPSQVAQHLVFDNQLQTPAAGGTLLGPVTATGVADIVSALGPRSPDHTAAQTDYRVATILVSRDGLLGSDAIRQYDYFAARAMEEVLVDYSDGFAQGQSKPFHLATRGIGHLDTRIMELLAHADFDADAVGSTPAASPPPNPPIDVISAVGAEVINSGVLGSHALRIDRAASGGPGTAVDFVVGGGPHTNRRYSVEYRAYAEVAQSGLGMSVRSPSGAPAITLRFLNGQFTLASGAGNETLPGTYPNNTAHTIRIEVNLDAGRASVAIDGAVVAANRPFLDASFDQLHELHFEYAPTILEALPGRYVVDDVEVLMSAVIAA